MIRSWVRAVVVALVSAAVAGSAHAQIIPRLPINRPVQQQPVQRDTLHDTLRVKWPGADSIMQALLDAAGIFDHAISGRHRVLRRGAQHARPAAGKEQTRRRRARLADDRQR